MRKQRKSIWRQGWLKKKWDSKEDEESRHEYSEMIQLCLCGSRESI